MKGQDELRDLWCSQPPWGEMKGEEIMDMVQKRIHRFDREVAMRNLREYIAAGFVAALFGWFGFRTHDPLMRTGFFTIVAGAVWIIYYLLSYGNKRVSADPSQNFTSYVRALIERYDEQIHLLRTVKYWYLLPLYIGLLLTTVASIRQRGKEAPWWTDLVPAAIYAAVFGGVWWLNEVVAVRGLRKERKRLRSLTEERELPGGAG